MIKLKHWNIGTLEHWNIGTFDIQSASCDVMKKKVEMMMLKLLTLKIIEMAKITAVLIMMRMTLMMTLYPLRVIRQLSTSIGLYPAPFSTNLTTIIIIIKMIISLMVMMMKLVVNMPSHHHFFILSCDHLTRSSSYLVILSSCDQPSIRAVKRARGVIISSYNFYQFRSSYVYLTFHPSYQVDKVDRSRCISAQAPDGPRCPNLQASISI